MYASDTLAWVEGWMRDVFRSRRQLREIEGWAGGTCDRERRNQNGDRGSQRWREGI